MEDVGNIPSTSLYKHLCFHSVWLNKGQYKLGVSWFAVLPTPGDQCQKFRFWYIKTCLVDCMCGLRNSEIGITFLLLAMHNVTVLHAGPLPLPRVCPGEVPPGSVVYAAAGIGQRRGGESGPRLFKCRKTSCVCKAIWAPELENLSEPFCCWFEETCVMKVFLGHY